MARFIPIDKLSKLTFEGMVGFIDPIREEVKESIKEFMGEVLSK